jgi:glyoxylase-like metal-dependent hydrolase (beta-lactamase superfamily II)
MRKPTRPREVGRGERVLPGVWRLRLPLPWPNVPHCNAWAIAAGDGIVLVDTGTHEPGSLAQLERALDQVGLRLEHVRLLVCTHAHADHCGQAGPILERAGCELWAHPNLEHFNAGADDPEAAHDRRVEIARQSGVPTAPPDRGRPLAAGPLHPDRDLVPGVEIETDLGTWSVHETPGHAPSHVCLFQPERRLLISGDHLLGRVSLYFDYGWTPDPVGEFLGSLDVTEALGARLALSGHGRPFSDVRDHHAANRKLVRERLDAVAAALAEGPSTAYDLLPAVYGDRLTPEIRGWMLTKVLCYLTHLELMGVVRRIEGEPEHWAAVGSL